MMYEETSYSVPAIKSMSMMGIILKLMEAAMILQGMESLSSPPKEKTVPRVDHNGDPLSYQDALLQDPANWPLAINEELQSHHENGTWTVISRPPWVQADLLQVGV